MTHQEQILKILGSPFNKAKHGMTCTEICKQIKLQNERSRHYLSGSISSILNKLVKQGKLYYHSSSFGPKGGHVYILNKGSQK